MKDEDYSWNSQPLKYNYKHNYIDSAGTIKKIYIFIWIHTQELMKVYNFNGELGRVYERVYVGNKARNVINTIAK